MQCPLWWKEERRCRNGTSRSCRKCCLVIVEEGYQGEAQKKKVEKKRRKRRTVKQKEPGRKNRSRSGCGHQEEGKRA